MPSGTALLYSIRIEPKLRTTDGSLRTSKRDEMATWSEPRVMTCREPEPEAWARGGGGGQHVGPSSERDRGGEGTREW